MWGIGQCYQRKECFLGGVHCYFGNCEVRERGYQPAQKLVGYFGVLLAYSLHTGVGNVFGGDHRYSGKCEVTGPLEN